MKEDTQELASLYPEIAIYSEHGISTGLDLEIFSVDVALNITELTDEELKALPTMYVDGTHHGNEGMSAEASFLFLKDVLERSAADPSYLEGKRLVVTPSVNPDGYSAVLETIGTELTSIEITPICGVCTELAILEFLSSFWYV